MSYVSIYVHFVWTTKYRTPILERPKSTELFNHIQQYSKTHDIYIDGINGYKDHIHCLVSLGKMQCVANIMNVIKGESAHWANKIRLFDASLEWAEGYYACSVSESGLEQLRLYIKNQEVHHSRFT